MQAKVMFASGDVGGARALLPVMHLCEKRSLPFVVLENGHIVSEIPGHWATVFPERGLNPAIIKKKFMEIGVETLVFTSSVKDPIPLSIARLAKDIGIRVIHLLDGWSAYQKRMAVDGLPPFVPHIYAVMDTFALESAIDAGVDPSVLVVTGQPALASLCSEALGHKEMNKKNLLIERGFEPDRILIVFISEPVAADQENLSCMYRGYTEKEVIQSFCQALQPFADRVQIGILPHPREDNMRLTSLWKCNKGRLKGRILHLANGRESLLFADGIAGMASILLYEAWLLGIPVISLQPRLRRPALRMLERRDGVVFVDSEGGIKNFLRKWVLSIKHEIGMRPRPDLKQHENAPARVLSIIENISGKFDFGTNRLNERKIQ